MPELAVGFQSDSPVWSANNPWDLECTLAAAPAAALLR